MKKRKKKTLRGPRTKNSALVDSLRPTCLENMNNNSPLLFQRTQPIPAALPFCRTSTLNFKRQDGGDSYLTTLSLEKPHLSSLPIRKHVTYAKIVKTPPY